MYLFIFDKFIFLNRKYSRAAAKGELKINVFRRGEQSKTANSSKNAPDQEFSEEMNFISF